MKRIRQFRITEVQDVYIFTFWITLSAWVVIAPFLIMGIKD